MGLLERGGLLRNDKSWGGQVRAAARAKECPRVEGRDRGSATPLMQPKKAKKAKPAPKANKKTWPNAGKYEPGKGKARGR
jgi:hypothetical protein